MTTAHLSQSVLIMNGSLKDYDEFASLWHFSPEPAQLSLSVVTPEHGITVRAPVMVEKEGGGRAGDI